MLTFSKETVIKATKLRYCSLSILNCKLLVICPIAIAQHGTDYKITRVCVSVILSVCLSPLLWSQFSLDFDETLHHRPEPTR